MRAGRNNREPYPVAPRLIAAENSSRDEDQAYPFRLGRVGLPMAGFCRCNTGVDRW
jgi:hypothetical protein